MSRCYHPDRRAFLRQTIRAALGGASLFSALGNLQLVAAATRTPYAFTDYKALVCVFLFGGNDSFNTIVPYDATHYGTYAATRPSLQLQQAALQANSLSPLALQPGLPGGPPSDGGSYGLHPAMAQLRGLFNTGKLGIVANVGTLLYPLTQAQYQSSSVPAPPQLFSHDDQTNFWMTSRPDDTNAGGWGGRIADMVTSGNPNQSLPMSVSMSGENLFQRGDVVNQYVMGYGNAPTIDYLGDYGNDDGVTAFNTLHASGVQAHIMERGFASATRSAISNYTQVNTALNGAPATPRLDALDSDIASQLRTVARLIAVRNTLGFKRQVYFVGVGPYDTHDDQIARQGQLLGELSDALAAFYDTTSDFGIASGVTTFTASDFGRTLSTNGDGSDHGWGGHHFVLGGAVRGGRFFGTMPSLAQNNNPDDAGYGQLIPTTAVDQYAATLASWFGVDAGGIADIFPNLGRFATPNLGFMLP